MGLSDIRLVVRLMCLTAAGRVGPRPPAPHGGETLNCESEPSGLAQCYLGYLSAAIEALAADNGTASRLLLQLCTQVPATRRSHDDQEPVSRIVAGYANLPQLF